MHYIIVLLLFFVNLYSKEILLLHSYNKGLKWSDGISRGVESVIKEHKDFELVTEYMDSKKHTSKEYFETLEKLYRLKYKNKYYKVIITADNYAFEFALKHHEDIFNTIPIVFCGVENFDKKKIPIYKQTYVTGVIEYKEIRRNFKLIKKLIPKLNTLYIISDNSHSSLSIKKQILDVANEFNKKFKVIYDNDIDLDSLEVKLNNLPPNSAILFTSLYRDRYGNYIPYNKLRKFFSNSKYPVFALNKIHLGEGVVGGVMVNPYEQGHLAAIKALEITKGKLPLQIDISKPVAQVYFDRKVLDKFGIDLKTLSIGATIINEPKSFFQKHRKFIDSIFLVMPLLVILIIILILNIYKRISLEIMLVEKNELDNVLLNNVQSAIFWKSKDGILLGCNDTLLKLLEMKKEDVIGKHTQDVMPELHKKISNQKDFLHEIETTIIHKGKKLNVLIRRKQYFNNKNEEAGVITIINDITNLKRLEERRKKDEQFIIQRSKLFEIGEMMTSIAHQWKNPLVEISAIAQELQYKRKKREISQEDTDKFVEDIMTQVNYMTNTIDDFRSFIKPSNKKSKFSVNKALEELLKVIGHNLKYNYIDVKTNYKKEKEYFIYGYPNEFKQSILNIINNAKDSILKKKEKIKDFQGKINISVEQTRESTCISIADNGIGIKEENLEKIFEPFVTTKKGGDGFGLYMVKLIIEDKMQGTIKAMKSKNGAKIKICIPKDIVNESISS